MKVFKGNREIEFVNGKGRFSLHNPRIKRIKKIKNIKEKSLLPKKVSEETRKKISDKLKGRFVGSNSPCWKGGKRLKGNNYPNIWTETLKRAVRERDNYTCQVCGKQQESKTFNIHHIDYNKDNCAPRNLITLCRNCHSKTNYKRNLWKEYFQGYFTLI